MEALDEYINAQNPLGLPEFGAFLRNLVKQHDSSEQADLIDSSRLSGGASGADVKNSKGQSRLHLAAKHRNGDLLRLHVGHARDVNAPDCRGNTPLHLLLSSGYSDTIDDPLLPNLARILLDHGANVEARNAEGKTPLLAAVACGSIAVLALLLDEHGADLKARDDRGFGVLHYLAGSLRNAPVCADILRMLLDRGCEVNAKSWHERTPLYVAVCTGHDACFRLLVEHGANIRCKDAKFDTTILHIAIKYAKVYVAETLIRILNEGDPCEKDAMINAKQKDSRTALHLATRHEQTSILRLLLRSGADVDSLDSLGRTALHYACYYNNSAAFDLLMDFGADINARDSRDLTPMKLNVEIEAVIWLRVVTRNVKSMAVGLPVVDFRENLSQIMRKMKRYEKYTVEVDQMKQAMINCKVSVYDLLLDEQKMYKYRNNVVLKEIVLRGKLFPSYREMLIGKYRRTGMRRYFVKLATKALWKMIGCRLESAICDMIFQKLSNAELHDFIEAALEDDQD